MDSDGWVPHPNHPHWRTKVVKPNEASANANGNGATVTRLCSAKTDAYVVVRPPLVTTFAELKPEPRTYLWPPYIPDNGYCIDGGRGGSGKTTVGIALCAWASTGRFPGMEPREPTRALIIELQDSDANEVKPKLIANNYDSNMVLRLESKKAPTIEELHALVLTHNPGIVLLSPLNRFVSHHVKSLNDDKELSRC